MKKRMLLSLVMVLLMTLTVGASAVQYTFIDPPYPGKPAVMDQVTGPVLEVDGYTYSLEDTYAYFSPEDTVKTESYGAVYEAMVDDIDLYLNTMLGLVVIEAPGDIYITVYEGSRETGKYMFTSYQLVEEVYYEAIYPSVDENYNLLTTDKIYLYEYELNGQEYASAMTLHIDYSGMIAMPLFYEFAELPTLEITPDEETITEAVVTFETEAEATVAEATVAEATVAEATVAEATVAEATVAEATVAEATVAEATVAEATVAEATVAEATVAEATVAEAAVALVEPEDEDENEPLPYDSGKEGLEGFFSNVIGGVLTDLMGGGY